MKMKILGILVCTLMIAATALPVVGTINHSVNNKGNTSFEISSMVEVMDQFQENCSDCEFFANYAWQQFVPTMVMLTRVEVSVAQWFGGSPDLTLSIERPLGYTLTSKSLPVTAIPDSYCDWVSFDVPNYMLTPGNTYYIVLSYPPGGEYGWCGTYGNPYPRGESNKDPDWDCCFRTFADETQQPDIEIEIRYVPSYGANVRNNGTTTVENINWCINCNRTLFGYGLVIKGKETTGTIESLAPGETESVDANVFGLAIVEGVATAGNASDKDAFVLIGNILIDISDKVFPD